MAASHTTLSGVAFNRLCRSALRSYAKFKVTVEAAAAPTLNNRSVLQGTLESLEKVYACDVAKLASYESLAKPLPDLTLTQLEEGLNSVRDFYEELRSKIIDLVSAIEPAPSSAQTRIDSPPNSNDSTANVPTASFPIQSVPKFSGRFSDWHNFFNRFVSIIDSSPALSVLHKFQYLIDSLDVNSQRLIAHLEFKEEFYNVAINLLRDQFDNPKLVAVYHAKELIKLSKLNSKFSLDYIKFVDSLKVHFRALEALSGVNEMEAITISLLLSKLDKDTSLQFEKYFNRLPNHGVIPTVNQLIKFLEDQVKSTRGAASHSLDETFTRPSTSKVKTTTSPFRDESFIRTSPSKVRTAAFASDPISTHRVCPGCNTTTHQLNQCSGFLAKSPRDRFRFVKNKRLCVNCLRQHSRGQCPSKSTCRQCQRPHHTLLHFGSYSDSNSPNLPRKSRSPLPGSSKPGLHHSEHHGPPSPTPPAEVAAAAATTSSHSILLATSLIKIQVSPHNYMVVRGIIDTAAGGSFISERCVQQLRCARIRAPVSVCGVGQMTATSKGICSLDIATLQGEVLTPKHMFIIMDRITKSTPSVQVSPAVHEAAKHLVLADPSFDKPSRVDCILGADIAALAFGQGSPINLGPDMPLAVPSPFGYVIMGSAPTVSSSNGGLVCSLASPDFPTTEAYCVTPSNDLHTLVERFWSREEPPPVKTTLSLEDQMCDQFFKNTTTRDSTGRYQVRLPFISDDHSLLDNSYANAYARFRALERKFTVNPIFKQQYVEFMNDYLAQGHMQLAPGPVTYYLPHHGIYKTHGDTSKIRVVFDASAKTASGKSLNDMLYSGPKLQPLLADVMSLFRQYPYVFSCDIRQMFRQILVHPDDRPYQCILWRSDPSQPIQTYCLKTVTYGTASAPYLAIRTLIQLADDESADFPEAAAALKRNVYVDDIAVGAHSLETALLLRKQLIALLGRGGFLLRKWIANHDSLLTEIPNDHLNNPPTNGTLCDTPFLGALWNPKTDTLKLRLKFKPNATKVITKRVILSTIAQIFDPCGWLAPFIMAAKCLLQRLWTLPLGWDTPLPEPLLLNWHSLMDNISLLENAFLPRPFSCTPAVCFALHGFCDASTAGYAAVLYLVAADLSTVPALLGAKTRVAPLKSLTIPRLELCGAHLLASLAAHFINLLAPTLIIKSTHLWTDSQIVLHWVRVEPYKLKTFVSNRVSQIQDWVPQAIWHHVPSADNPADLASRGAHATQLLHSFLWWRGPLWLTTPTLWPTNGNFPVPDSSTLELAEPISVHLAESLPVDMFSRISSWGTLLRVVKVILSWKPSSRHCASSPTLHSVLNAICFYIQRVAFAHDIAALKAGKPCSAGVQHLTPFFDSHGLIRVGGRLKNASTLHSQHPILLPKNHYLVNLLIDHYHLTFLHAGLNFILSQLAVKFWIISSRQAVRSRIFRCMVCFRAKPTHEVPLMGQLPASRVTPSLTFAHTGMDFAGPYLVKASHLRKAPELRVYLCLFICFATKAVHLELASDLSSSEFLDVLQRFISRRGCPAHLYSDCGTNFVGASAALRKALTYMKSDPAFTSLIESFSFLNGIEFHFNPPSAPHQGGLWERAVQSAKHHLSRLLRNQTITYKVLNTIVIRIEGILNSRPITPMSSDPNDFSALSPGHFLVGRSLTVPPEIDQAVIECTPRQLHIVNRTIQTFWSRWKAEYLPSLLPRRKWSKLTPNLSVGDLVLVDEPNTSPLFWPLGRVVHLFPGSDGVVRRARVTTASSQLVRPAIKLFKLPIY